MRGRLIALLLVSSCLWAQLAAARETVAVRQRRVAQLNRLVARVRARPSGANVDRLLGRVAQEPERALQRFAFMTLDRRRNTMNRAQRSQLALLRREVLPPRPPTPTEGRIEVRHFIGDEFFRPELAAYRRAGFTLTGKGDRRIATRGRLRVEIRRGDQHIFRDLGDPGVHAVVFSGHSDVGGVTTVSLRDQAPLQRGDKLVVMLNCKGVQTLPLVAARYPSAHLLTTKDSSYEPEDLKVLHSLYDGLERNESYRQVRARVRRGGDVRNYLFPDHARALAHWDVDRDGRLDHAAGPAGPGRFDASLLDRRLRTPGQTLLGAVEFVNSTESYYAEDTPNAVITQRDAKDRFVSAGIGRVAGDAVTKIRARQLDGRPRFEVKLNRRLVGEPKDFLQAAAAYEMHLHLTRSVRGRVTERDQQRALLIAGDSLLRNAPYTNQAEPAMQRLSVRYGFPKLAFHEIEAILQSDHENLATDAQLDAVARLVRAKTDPSRASSR